MIPVGTKVNYLTVDYLDETDAPFNVVGTVTSIQEKGSYEYIVRITDGRTFYFKPHQIVSSRIAETEIYKALTEGE